LAFAVLRALAGFMQTDFLAFNFAGIAGDKACLAQWLSQTVIVFHQRTGNAMTYGASLSGNAAASDSDINIKLVQHIDCFQWLADDHAAGFAAEISIESTIINNDIATAFFQEYACC